MVWIQRRRAAGLGLVDTLIAMSLLLIGLLSALSAVLSGSSLARTDAETRVATHVAAQLLDEIRATPFDDVIATYHDTTVPLAGRAEGAGQGSARITVVEDATGFGRWPVYIVTISVRLEGVNGARICEVASCISNAQPDGAPF